MSWRRDETRNPIRYPLWSRIMVAPFIILFGLVSYTGASGAMAETTSELGESLSLGLALLIFITPLIVLCYPPRFRRDVFGVTIVGVVFTAFLPWERLDLDASYVDEVLILVDTDGKKHPVWVAQHSRVQNPETRFAGRLRSRLMVEKTEFLALRVAQGISAADVPPMHTRRISIATPITIVVCVALVFLASGLNHTLPWQLTGTH